MLKRLIDILASLFALLIFSPVLFAFVMHIPIHHPMMIRNRSDLVDWFRGKPEFFLHRHQNGLKTCLMHQDCKRYACDAWFGQSPNLGLGRNVKHLGELLFYFLLGMEERAIPFRFPSCRWKKRGEWPRRARTRTTPGDGARARRWGSL